jgi:hypothetical protein
MKDETIITNNREPEIKMLPSNIPYIVYESSQAAAERYIKRLFWTLIVCIILLFVSNAFWLYNWCQYDYTSTETTYNQDGQGLNIMGDNNDVTK